MTSIIGSILLIAIASLVPIVLWGYIFSYIDNSQFSRRRFVVGLVGGIISVIPILFFDRFLESSGFHLLNIFQNVLGVNSIQGLLTFSVSLLLFVFILVGFSFIAISWTHRSKHILKIYMRNIGYFSLMVLFLSGFIFLFSVANVGTQEIADAPSFGVAVFNTLKLVIFYYILIAFIEEASKHFNFLQSSVAYIDSVQKGVLYAIFVALGFAFIENILYLYSELQYGGFSGTLGNIYFYRSVFSVMVHVLCSAVVGYAFSTMFLRSHKKCRDFASVKIFFVGLLLGVTLHLLFDVALTLGFSFVIILYFIGGYLYVSSIFYKE